MEKAIIKITGMHCASCANTIEKAVKKIEGVQDVVVNFAAEKILVDYDETKLNKREIEEAIERVGYSVIREEKENELRVKIIGMDNPHCVETIDNALASLKGIISKKLLVNEKAIIKYDEKQINKTEILKLLKNTGYEPIEEKEVIDKEKEAREREINQLKKEFFLAAILSLPILLLSFPEWFKIILPYQNWIMFALASQYSFMLV